MSNVMMEAENGGSYRRFIFSFFSVLLLTLGSLVWVWTLVFCICHKDWCKIEIYEKASRGVGKTFLFSLSK